MQDEITLRDLPVTLLGGTRYDNYRGSSSGYDDVDADKWSSRAGLTVSPADWLMLFGSYARAFRAPTMGEMYNDSKHFSIGSFYTNYWCRTRTCVRKLTKPVSSVLGYVLTICCSPTTRWSSKPATSTPKRKITSPLPSILRRPPPCPITYQMPKSGAGT